MTPMTASLRAIRPHRGARATLLALLIGIAACGDGPVGTEWSMPLGGPYSARDAVRDDGSQLVADGYAIGLRVGTGGPPPIFRLAVVPPPVEFEAPVVYEGYAEALSEDRVQFHSPQMEPLDVALVTSSDGNTVLEFEEGRFGFRRVVFEPAERPGADALDGAFTAGKLFVQDADGTTADITGSDPPATLTFGADSSAYRFEAEAPAGTVADTAVSLSYGGLYDLIGPVLVLSGGFGCNTFAASAAFGERLLFQGHACEIDGRPWLVEAEFDPQ